MNNVNTKGIVINDVYLSGLVVSLMERNKNGNKFVLHEGEYNTEAIKRYLFHGRERSNGGVPTDIFLRSKILNYVAFNFDVQGKDAQKIAKETGLTEAHVYYVAHKVLGIPKKTKRVKRTKRKRTEPEIRSFRLYKTEIDWPGAIATMLWASLVVALIELVKSLM